MSSGKERLYWIRRVFFYYIFYAVIGMQLDFVLFSFFGVSYPPAVGIFVALFGFPVTMTVISMAIEARFKRHRICKVDWRIWGIIGPVLFALWGLGYFLTGHMADPSRAMVLDHVFDRFIPFDHYWVFFYLSVYPMFLLPYFHVKRGRSLITLTLSYFIMLTISYSVFLALPVVMYTRPDIPTTDFSSWCVNIVYGQDPLWNCLPSTHCGVAMISAIAMFRDNRKFGTWAIISTLLIGASTLFTKQHYIVDMLAGYVLAMFTYWLVYRIVEPKMPKKIHVPGTAYADDVDIS